MRNDEVKKGQKVRITHTFPDERVKKGDRMIVRRHYMSDVWVLQKKTWIGYFGKCVIVYSRNFELE